MNTFDMRITRKKGASWEVAWIVQDEDGTTTSEDISGWTVVMTIKETPDANVAAATLASGTELTIDNSAKTISSNATETIGLSPGHYKGDLKITKADNSVHFSDTFDVLIQQPVG